MSLFFQLLSRLPVSDTEELKKLAEKALATLKSWFLLAQEQLHSLGIDNAEEFYGLPFVWFQKVRLYRFHLILLIPIYWFQFIDSMVLKSVSSRI